MNNHTPLDEEFIDACGKFDFEKVKELVEKGANIHAADQCGDTAMETMMMSYDSWEMSETGDSAPRNINHDNFIKIARPYLALISPSTKPDSLFFRNNSPVVLREYALKLHCKI